MPAIAPPLVDSHVHIFRRNMPLVPQPRHRPDYEYTAEDLAATLSAHGVQHCVIAAASPWGDVNDYVIRSLRSRPQWRGTVIVDPTTRASSPTSPKRWLGRVENSERNLTVIRSRITRKVRPMPYFDFPATRG